MLIDGRAMAKDVEESLAGVVNTMQRAPKLLVLQVGDNPASESFIRMKQKFAKRVGMEVELLKFPQDTKEDELIKLILKANTDNNINGIIVQLPLPKTFNIAKIINSISEHKDPDVLSAISYAKFVTGESSILPPVVGAIATILKRIQVDLVESDIAIVGFGKLVGQPVAEWLKQQGLEYVVATDETKNLSALLLNADVIISGAGSAGLIKPDMIKEGVVILDVGTSDLPIDPNAQSSPTDVLIKSKLTGDVDPACQTKASFMSPVPGGIGPLAVAMLFKNLLELSGSAAK